MDTTENFILSKPGRRFFACLGSPTTGEHILVELGDGGMTPEQFQDARARSFIFAGIFGCTPTGEFDMRLEPGVDAGRVMAFGSATFGRYLYEQYGPAVKSDTVDWLTKLFQIPDMRDN